MSTNIPIGGNGGQPRLDPTKGADVPASAPPQPSKIPDKPLVEISNTRDMKKAEYKGAHISISDEQLIRAIEKAMKQMQGPDTVLDFSVHEKTKQIMVKVLNKDSGEIIREIPPEKHLDFVAKLWEMAGIIIDERR
ncbi:flagellar protein FlaG [Paenibacillus koleovorans]|uniref:flagellar protein FlaG n=1 Tax=Paenibacillus koleovorans TaxID=121608 RepID=UPI000FDA53ED|nr:flagellar protein FlaG [Paenibacillus koleovorans]